MNTSKYTYIHYGIAIIGVLILLGLFLVITRKNETPPTEPMAGQNEETAGKRRNIKVSQNIDVFDGTKKIKHFSQEDLKSMSRGIGEQRMIFLKDLINELDRDHADGFRFTGFNGEIVDISWDKVMYAKEDLVLLSTHAPAWKLVRQQEGNTVSRGGGPRSLIMRAVKSITIVNGPQRNLPNKATNALCENPKIYLSIQEALREKDQVCILNLTGKNLKEIPQEITQFPKLKVLYIGHNNLTSLSPVLGELKGLVTLNLHGNQLTSLIPEIGKLENLQTLKLGRNKLTTLPPSIGNLTKLEKLELDNNQLTSLPKEIGGLTSLTELEFAHNKLKSLPKEIRKLKNVTEIDIEENPLNPEEIQILKQAFPNADIEL